MVEEERAQDEERRDWTSEGSAVAEVAGGSEEDHDGWREKSDASEADEAMVEGRESWVADIVTATRSAIQSTRMDWLISKRAVQASQAGAVAPLFARRGRERAGRELGAGRRGQA